MSPFQGSRESRGGPGKTFHAFHTRSADKRIHIGVAINFRHDYTRVKEIFYTNQYRESITDYSTQVFTHYVQTMQWKEKQHEDATQKGNKVKASYYEAL